MDSKLPEIGDVIYVYSAMFMSRGRDDRLGGKARVSSIRQGMSGGDHVHFVFVEAFPGIGHNWEQHLAKRQGELRDMFGDSWARPDPDDRPEFNRW